MFPTPLTTDTQADRGTTYSWEADVMAHLPATCDQFTTNHLQQWK